jgi:hypothetical protein
MVLRRYIMAAHESMSKELAKGAGLFVGHVIAIAGGLVLMIAGIALGVTIVALPIGIVVGLAGLGAFLWGLFGWSQHKLSGGAASPTSRTGGEGEPERRQD